MLLHHAPGHDPSKCLFPQVPLLATAVPGATIPSFLKEILTFTGYQERDLLIASVPTRVSHLAICAQGQQLGVPTPPSYLRLIEDNMNRQQELLQRTDVADKVVVSRRSLPPSSGRTLGEGFIVSKLEDAGFAILDPQRHGFLFQMQIYANASKIVFFEGSAVHGTDFLCNLNHVYLIRRRLSDEFDTNLALRSSRFTCVNQIHWLGTLSPNGSAVRGVSFVAPAALRSFFETLGIGIFDQDSYVAAINADFEQYVAAPLWRSASRISGLCGRITSLRVALSNELEVSGLRWGRASASRTSTVIERS
jgi:hypothetical protein